MAGKKGFEGSEGDEFSTSELLFGDLFENQEEEAPDDQEVIASAEEEGDDNAETDDESEEQEEADDEEGGEEEEVEYEDDEEEETPPQAKKPAPKAPAADTQNPPADQSPQSSAPPKRSPVLHEILRQNAEQLIPVLAKQPAFALPKEEAELFDDPGIGEFVARNNARMYITVMSSMSEWLHTALPAAVMNLSGADRQAAAEEQAFIQAYPDLKDVPQQKLSEYGAFVIQQRGNKISKQEFMNEVAGLARMIHGIKPQAPGKTPPAKKDVKTRSRVPYVPANRGAAPAPKGGKSGKPKNTMADLNAMLAMDFED